MSSPDGRIAASAIKTLITDALAAASLPHADAALCAELMTEADLTGFDAHGVFRMNVTAPARAFPTLTKTHSLMSVHYPAVREKILWRYPFFRSTFFERRMLFERHETPLQPANDQLPLDAPTPVLGLLS